jgi:hypothetical protein
MDAQCLTFALLIFSLLGKLLAEEEIDIDEDGQNDVKIHKNSDNQIILFSNQVYRNGIKKITENVDVSQVDDIKLMMETDKAVANKLKTFKKIRKIDIGSECPNFEYKHHVDDIKDGKFINEYDTNTSTRVMHGEYFSSYNGFRFIVTISKLDTSIVCHYEYSAAQTLLLQTTSLGNSSIQKYEINIKLEYKV